MNSPSNEGFQSNNKLRASNNSTEVISVSGEVDTRAGTNSRKVVLNDPISKDRERLI